MGRGAEEKTIVDTVKNRFVEYEKCNIAVNDVMVRIGALSRKIGQYATL